ncbi:MAG: hypothetical protein JWO42_614 [Chloroflexi bacterium]|nr:hypothetical protein [Chloroflexota bacterium]
MMHYEDSGRVAEALGTAVVVRRRCALVLTGMLRRCERPGKVRVFCPEGNSICLSSNTGGLTG